MNILRLLAYPAIQILAAATALTGWFILDAVASDEFQRTPILVLAYGTPLSLVIALGTPYLLPNLFRSDNESPPTDARRSLVSFSISTSWVIAIPTTIAGLLAPGTAIGLVGAMGVAGASLSSGISVAQLGRSIDSIRIAAIGALGPTLAPLAWTGSSMANVSADAALRVFILVQFAYLLAATFETRSYTLSPRYWTWRAIYPEIQRGIALLPHLVAFGIIVQGIRLTSTFAGPDGNIVQSHTIMLAVQAGFTLAASMNSILGVRLQTLPEGSFPIAQRKFLLAYGGTGLLCGLLTTAGIIALQLANNYSGSIVEIAALCAALPTTIVAYYSFSSQLMRYRRTLPISAASITALLVMFLPYILFKNISVPQALILYLTALLTLLAAAAVQATIPTSKAPRISRFHLIVFAGYVGVAFAVAAALLVPG